MKMLCSLKYRCCTHLFESLGAVCQGTPFEVIETNVDGAARWFGYLKLKANIFFYLFDRILLSVHVSAFCLLFESCCRAAVRHSLIPLMSFIS